SEILGCLDEIEKHPFPFDAVAIIRGGGGRTDLAAFDNLPMAVRIANFPIPVLIGIGHEIDQSVLDLVAYQSLKTPTAVADFVVEHNAAYEIQLDDIARQLKDEIQQRVQDEEDRINRLIHDLTASSKSSVLLEYQKIENLRYQLLQSSQHRIQLQRTRIDHIETLLQAIHPDHVLARGYTITSHNGITITKSGNTSKGMRIQTTFQDGQINSTVE
ncbi:MAG TPA: exodeoxyribonuclease VII large subunit, partial [Saprospiraceae bacterium]|nr:exodeoxyribonuclease VII large subunit [Saprospiraceae bacterium]